MCVTVRNSFDDKDSLTFYPLHSGARDMKPWLKVSLLLCIFGLIKEFRPSEPFITEYLINPPMNFTMEQVSQEIFPYSIYSYMISLIIVFLVTDYLRYKIIIVLDAVSGFVAYMMLIFCRSLFAMQVLEIIYGLFMAGEVAYYTYVYAKVDKKYFQAVTSHTRTAYLVGRSVSGITSQIIVSSHLFSYVDLQIFTAGGLALASVWACFLPSVKTSIYFHRRGSSSSMEEKPNCWHVFYVMLADLKHAFTNTYVIKLLFWSVFATGGYYQVLSFIQLLWEVISNTNEQNEEKQILWNGAVETCYTILGAISTFTVGKINLSWYRYCEYLLAVNSLLMSVLIYVMSQTHNLWIAYVTFVTFAILYQASITIVNSEIAQNLKEDSYGLIFGVAMFFSLVAQTLLTAVAVGGHGFGLPPRLQFVVYGAYYNIVGVLIICKVLICAIARLCGYGKGSIPVASSTL